MLILLGLPFRYKEIHKADKNEFSTPCPPGSYRSSTGGQASTDCTTCPAGSYCSSFGGTAVSGSCQAGYYCPAGSLLVQTF